MNGLMQARLDQTKRGRQDPDGETNDGKAYPLVLGGKTYLMLLGHQAIGWRDQPDSILVLFDLKDGKLTEVATATVFQRRVSLKSVQVTATR